MLDNQLFPLIIQVINASLAAQSITGVTVRQSYQPTQQGTPSGPSLNITKIYDHRHGFIAREEIWNPDISEMVFTETQVMESRFQISALSIQNPANQNQLTATDLVNAAAFALQSQATLDTFQNNNVGIERIMDIRIPQFADDYDRYEANPNFDFTLTHKQVIISDVPIVDNFTFNLNRV